MKRIIVLIAVALMLAGCEKAAPAEKPAAAQKQERVGQSMFETVEMNYQWTIVADRKTGVMYAVSMGTDNIGSFTVLVDAEGNPLIWGK